MSRMAVAVGDITRLEIDAIVNAANSALAGGGGVDGAINRAAGPALAEAGRRIGRCKTGRAVITPGFALPARHVIHTVGPIWLGGTNREDDQLASCYRESIALAAANDIATLAFPCISTGVYRFPPERAAAIAVAATGEALAAQPSITAVTFCCFHQADADRYTALLAG